MKESSVTCIIVGFEELFDHERFSLPIFLTIHVLSQERKNPFLSFLIILTVVITSADLSKQLLFRKWTSMSYIFIYFDETHCSCFKCSTNFKNTLFFTSME